MQEFNSLITRSKVDRLEQEGGACIVYTHFASGFVDNFGKLNKEFESNIKYLSKKAGWFVPASTLLDYLITHKGTDYVSNLYLANFDFKWVLDRIVKKLKYRR